MARNSNGNEVTRKKDVLLFNLFKQPPAKDGAVFKRLLILI